MALSEYGGRVVAYKTESAGLKWHVRPCTAVVHLQALWNTPKPMMAATLRLSTPGVSVFVKSTIVDLRLNNNKGWFSVKAASETNVCEEH